MRASRAAVATVVAGAAACQQIFGLDQPTVRAPGDGAVDVSGDAGTCGSACAWGCITTPTPHCGQLVPAGGGITTQDTLDFTGLAATTLDQVLVNVDTGALQTGTSTFQRGSGSGVINGIDYVQHGGVAVFRFSSLAISGDVVFVGTRPVVFVADTMIQIDAMAGVQGFCAQRSAGPGGFLGGASEASATGSGAGSGNSATGFGGGGGGYGGNAGVGANNTASGGAAFGDAMISVLVGGGGGGGGGGAAGGAGGGGGGALQLVANGPIAIGSGGGINAGGCGGQNGSGANEAGGAGGAGGTILIEAPTITIAGALAVNGGAGGGGATSSGGRGGDGTLDRTPASSSASGGTPGGSGAAGAMIDGYPSPGGGPSGGGGSVGRIRLNTLAGTASVDPNAVLSPSLSDSPTTCTQGRAAVK